MDDARIEYGSEPYNGTISTTNGVTVMHSTPTSSAGAHRLADQLLDKTAKWGAAGAIPLAESRPPVEKELKLRVRGPIVDSGRRYQKEFIEQVVDAAKLTASQCITRTDVKGQHWDGTFDNTVKITAKVTAAATQGASATRYFVIPGDGQNSQHPAWFANNWDHGHPTQAAARAAAVETLSRSTGAANQTLTVVAHTLREDKEPLVRIERAVKAVEVTVVVTIADTEPASPKRIGWLFFGWAAC